MFYSWCVSLLPLDRTTVKCSITFAPTRSICPVSGSPCPALWRLATPQFHPQLTELAPKTTWWYRAVRTCTVKRSNPTGSCAPFAFAAAPSIPSMLQLSPVQFSVNNFFPPNLTNLCIVSFPFLSTHFSEICAVRIALLHQRTGSQRRWPREFRCLFDLSTATLSSFRQQLHEYDNLKIELHFRCCTTFSPSHESVIKVI